MPREDDVMFSIGRIKITRRTLGGFFFIPVGPIFVFLLSNFDVERALATSASGRRWLLMYSFPTLFFSIFIFYLFYDNMKNVSKNGDV